MRRPRALPSLAVATLATLALTACGGGDDDDGATPEDTPSSTTSTTAPEPTTDELDLDLPRTLSYAGAELIVETATVTAGDDGDAELRLEITSQYADGYPGAGGVLPISGFSLVTAEEDAITAQSAGIESEVPIPVNGSGAAVLVFAAGTEDVEGASLVYDDGEHEPARLPLTDPVPESAYPISTDVGETATAEMKTGCEPSAVEVTLQSVAWDIDAGVGVDGERLVQGATTRAAVGERWVRAAFEVVAGTGQCGGTYPNHEQFAVRADGTAIAPVNTLSVSLADGESVQLAYGFPVPADAETVELVVGAAGAANATFPVTVPDELP